MKHIESKRDVPGLNSFEQNYKLWNNYNWNKLGEEWTVSDEWKKKLVKMAITSELKSNDIVVEIGPGGGRMTEYLLKHSSRLICIDISKKCIDLLKKRFTENENIEYHLITTIELPFIRDGSVDVIFSYDVFVHINKKDFEKYFKEFNRILNPDGKIIIHYNKIGEGFNKNFSNFTQSDFNELCLKYGFKIVKDIDPYNLRYVNEEEDNATESISILKRYDNDL